MKSAMAGGFKPWNRSKIMFVGEGRVGKTALCNSMMGNGFVETESTVGFTRQVFEVRTFSGGGENRWTERKKPERECEAGIAQIIIDTLNLNSRTVRSENESPGLEEEYSVEELLADDGGDQTKKKKLNARIYSTIKNISVGLVNIEELLLALYYGEYVPHTINPIVVALHYMSGVFYDVGFTILDRLGNYNNNENIERISAQTMYMLEVNICITNMLSYTIGFVLTSFVFGVQCVFNVIYHLFLTSYGVYLAMYKMHDRSRNNDDDKNGNIVIHKSVSAEVFDSSPVNIPMVRRCMTNRESLSSGLILSLFDFGGQSVFSFIHHLFLTSYGVYVVVFNMMDILDNYKREQSLNELSFWINSIIIHTRNADSGKVAPVFLVGTHKDHIEDPARHKDLSDFIEKRFQYNVAWKCFIENGDLCFFPVNNLKGQQDDVIVDLMSKIENNLKEADYVKEPRPLTWLKALDELLGTGNSFLTLKDALSIAIKNGVEEDAVYLFLSFLNEMGVVLWLDEDGLRDVVILDIVSSFVEPATRIICNHIYKTTKNFIHNNEIQNYFKKNRKVKWDLMTRRGVVQKQLIIDILQFRAVKDLTCDAKFVVNMMLKYGLMVTLNPVQDRLNILQQESNEMYLVPALLAEVTGHPCIFNDKNWIDIPRIISCYYVLSTDKEFVANNKINAQSLKLQGFLPRGLMERLIGKAVKWSQLTNITNIHEDEYLFRNYAHLSYGHQRFRIMCIPEIHCIRLDIEGEHPLPIHDRIHEQIDICIKECMGSLYFATFLRMDDRSELVDGFTLVSLEAVRDDKCSIRHEGRLLDRTMFSSWVINKDTLPSYDVFISHRWDDNDDVVTKLLYDTLLGYHTVGSDHSAITVFLDHVRLREGHQFQQVFGEALINSTLFVPIICESALTRMFTHNPAQDDNVLIEWMLALECKQDLTHAKMRAICPLMFGKKREDGSVSPFDASIKDRLPDTIPKKSIATVKYLLKKFGVLKSTELDTVKTVVLELMNYLGEWPKETETLEIITLEASKKIIGAVCKSGTNQTTGLLNNQLYLLLTYSLYFC